MGERGTEVPIAGKTLRSCSTVGNRPVRTRTQGGVGGGGRNSPRLPDYAEDALLLLLLAFLSSAILSMMKYSYVS